jgi:hypothetical protein
VCQLKTLIRLQPLARFDAKHCRYKVITNTLNEDAIVDIKQKGHSTMHKQFFKDVDLVTGFDKERLKRQKLGFNTRKFRRNHSQPQIKKVDGDAITTRNSVICNQSLCN